MVSLFALSLVTVTLVPPAISISSSSSPEAVGPSNLIFVVPSGTNKSYFVSVFVSVELIVSLFALSLVTVTFVPPAISTSSSVLSLPVNLIFVVVAGTDKS